MAAEESLEALERRGREEAAGALRALDARLRELVLLRRSLRVLGREWSGRKPIESCLASLPAAPPVAPGPAASGEEVVETALGALRDTVAAWVREEREGRRRRLAEGLKEGCAAARVPLVVVTKDPLELRLAPLGVAIDVETDRAQILFGRVEVERAQAGAGPILEARRKALSRLEGEGFGPEAFHRQLREAWSRALRSARKGGADWIDMIEVLPEIACLRQGSKWRMDPTASHFRGYGKAQLLFDLWRVKRARALVVDGWRLTLGPATGASTKDKRRVFWVEDDEGRGAYHLTMRFTRVEEVHGDAREDDGRGGGGDGQAGEGNEGAGGGFDR